MTDIAYQCHQCGSVQEVEAVRQNLYLDQRPIASYDAGRCGLIAKLSRRSVTHRVARALLDHPEQPGRLRPAIAGPERGGHVLAQRAAACTVAVAARSVRLRRDRLGAGDESESRFEPEASLLAGSVSAIFSDEHDGFADALALAVGDRVAGLGLTGVDPATIRSSIFAQQWSAISETLLWMMLFRQGRAPRTARELAGPERGLAALNLGGSEAGGHMADADGDAKLSSC